MAPETRANWKRRLIRTAAVLLLLLVAAVAAIPWLLGTPPGRALVLSQVNKAISPGRMEAKALRFSWSGPIRARGVVLKAEGGKAVVSAPSVTWDRGLWRLLTERPNYGTITLEGASCDVTRREDGSIDLVDALGLGSKPEAEPPKAPVEAAGPSRPTVATLKVVGGSLRLRSPELPNVLVAERFDLTLDQPAPPGPRAFDVKLARPGGEALEVAGRLDAASDLSLALAATSWTTDVAASGVAAKGRLDGKAAVALRGGFVASSGDARLSQIVATGPALSGDRVALDAVKGAWDVAQGSTGWTVRRLDVASPIGSLKSDRPIPAPAGGAATISGRIDLAALAKQAPHALRLREGLDLRSGTAEVRVEVREDAGAQRLAVTAKLSDLVGSEPGRPAPIVLRDPATLDAALTARGRAVRVEQLGLAASGLTVQGSGDLERGVKVAGHFDLAALERQFRDLVDLRGLDLAGLGRFAADYRRKGESYTARYRAEVKGLKVVRPGAEPIVRELVNLDGEVEGAADVSGAPTSWRTARLGLGLPDLAASARVTPGPGGMAISAAVARPTLLEGHPGRGEVRLAVVWTEAALEIGELHAGLTPAPPAKAIEIAARGRYDLASGSLALEPLPSAPPSSIMLAPGGLRVSGLGKSTAGTTVEGGLVGDLAAVDRLWAAFSESAPYGLDGPFGLAVKADYHSEADRLDLSQLVLTSRYGSTGMAGEIKELGGRRDATLAGTLSIDKATLDELVASAVAPDARLAARARPFHLRGPLSGDVLRQVEADAGLDIDGASAAGLKLGPAPVVARLSGGKVAIDPIRSTLNGGEVEIHSEVTLDRPGGATVRLLPGTAIRGAVIDDELSARLLSYVAPVLHDATQVRGRVSMAMDRAEFPVGGPTRRWASLAGSVQFQDVVFGPGPVAAEVLALAPLKREPQVRLDETIQVSVAEGRVYQKGLSIPVGRGESLGLEGSVGFDRTLALRAMVPIPVAALAGRGGRATEGLADLRVPVAIGGTFAQPRIDRQAMAKALRQEGRSAIRREAETGVNELIRKLGSEAGAPRRR